MKKFLLTALVGASALAFAAGAFAEGDAAINSQTQLNTDAAASSADNSVAHGTIQYNENGNAADSISATSTTGTRAGTASGTIDANGNAAGMVGTRDGDDEANGRMNANASMNNGANVSADMDSKTGVMKTRAKGAMGMLNPSEIKTVQQNLREAGYKVSTDGVWGPQTRSALKEFQKSKNLHVTGRVDADTRSSLGLSNNGTNSAVDSTGSYGGAQDNKGND